jgi:hypothetical protein
MAEQGGFGVVVRINTGALTAVANLIDVDFPEINRIIAENTAHDASGGYYTAIPSGKRRVNPFPMELGWNDAEATHAAMLTNFGVETSVGFNIQDPDGQEVIAFSGYIESVGRISKQDGNYRCRIMVHPTGAPTIT